MDTGEFLRLYGKYTEARLELLLKETMLGKGWIENNLCASPSELFGEIKPYVVAEYNDRKRQERRAYHLGGKNVISFNS